MEMFVMCMLVLLAVINLAIAISTSLLLIKTYEVVKTQEERVQLEVEARRQAKGLVDVETPQIPYSLRR